MLRYYQNDAVSSIRNYWNNGGQNPLVEMATGTGKSLTQAALIKSLIADFPNLTVMCLVHVRELVAQNTQAMIRAWPGAPIGINSAGLNRRDTRSQILFASIQSVFRETPKTIGRRDLFLIDEAHLVPKDGEGMYRTLLGNMIGEVPDLRVAGFTATAFRTGSGRLDKGENRLFSEIVFRYGISEGINDGYLSKPVTKATETQIDVSSVHVRNGEFVASELEIAVDNDFVTKAAVKEIMELGKDRRSWICFCTGVKHAANVANELRSNGVSAEMVSGNTPKTERDRIFQRFKDGSLRALTNCAVATTGFDAPNIDLVALLRPTLSPVLYVQMIGRGTRIAPGKENCLVLDFAGNIKRHGPVDSIKPKSVNVKGPKEPDEEPSIKAKECPGCKSMLHFSALDCPECGHDFRKYETDLPKHDVRADAESAILSSELPKWRDVETVKFYPHEKSGSPTSLRVEYVSGANSVREFVCFEHTGYPRARAVSWWQRVGGEVSTPKTVSEAVARLSEIGSITAVQVRRRDKFFDVVNIKVAGKTGQRTAGNLSAVL